MTRNFVGVSHMDEFGALLGSYDSGFLAVDAVSGIIPHSSGDSRVNRTLWRAARLQKAGLIPRSIQLPFFVCNALQAGSSEQAILNGLLLRGALNLKEQSLAWKALAEREPPNELKRFAEERDSANEPKSHADIYWDEKPYLKEQIKNHEEKSRALLALIDANQTFMLDFLDKLRRSGF